MKEQRIKSKLRGKIRKDSEAKVYKLTQEEALDFIKKHFIEPCESIEQLDSMKLIPSFPMLATPDCRLGNWRYQHGINRKSLSEYYYMNFFDEKDLYYCGLFWLTGGAFNSKVKKLVEEKKKELINTTSQNAATSNDSQV